MDTYSSWEIAFSGHACVNFLSNCHLEAPAEHSGASSTAMGTWGVLHTAKGRLIWLEWFLPVIAAMLCNMNRGGQFRKTWTEVLGMSEELPSLQSSDSLFTCVDSAFQKSQEKSGSIECDILDVLRPFLKIEMVFFCHFGSTSF